jgi:hypothetical protein
MTGEEGRTVRNSRLLFLCEKGGGGGFDNKMRSGGLGGKGGLKELVGAGGGGGGGHRFFKGANVVSFGLNTLQDLCLHRGPGVILEQQCQDNHNAITR